MAHDVFISYSSKDKPIADGICASLEAAGLRCWIAPRDIGPGEEWPKAITNAIAKSQVMVLVFSSNSNASSDVGREIVLAANKNLVIIPFKIENVEPEPGKQYYLAQTHWLEAMNPPTKDQIKKLIARVQAIIPPLDVEPIVQPASTPPSLMEQPSSPLPAVKLGWWRRSYLWAGIPLILILLAMAFWPKFQGMLASQKATPTLPATTTLPPISTLTSSATPTEMSLPSVTPSTGTVTGSIVWGSKPYEGVTVTLCSDWKIKCNGLEYSAVTDAQGSFSISGIEPGEFQMVTIVPEQLGIFYPGDKIIKIQVNAGETIELEPVLKCKYDLKATAPVIQNGKVTLHWSAYPGATIYTIDIYDKSWNNVAYIATKTTSGTPLSTTDNSNTIEPGNYFYLVSMADVDGGCACAFGQFSIP